MNSIKITEGVRSSRSDYGVSFVAVMAAVIVRLLLEPLLADSLPFITLYLAVGFAAWYGGKGPGLLALVGSVVAAAFFIIQPRYSFAVENSEYQIGLVLYAVSGLAIVAMFESMRKVQRLVEKQRGQMEQGVEARSVAERGFAEQAERLRTTLASIGDAVIATDIETRITNMNAAAESLTGWTAAEAMGKPLEEVFRIVNETTRQSVESPVTRVLNQGVIAGLANHTLLIAKDGTERSIDDIAAPIKCKDSEVVGRVLVFRDVTEQKIHQEKVRRSEARLRQVFESNVVGMIRWDLDQGLILEANDTFLKMSGFTRDDVAAGRLNFRDMTPPDWTARNEEGIRTIRADGYASPYEKEYFRKDGSRLPLIIAGTRFEDSLSEGMSFLIDISESKRAEQEIARLAVESERQRRLYETVLTNTPDFMYVFSLDHRVIYANEALITMWGRGYEGAIGKTFLEIGYEPWHAEMHNREIDQVRATRQPIRGEVPFDGTNGRRQYDYIFVPVIGADGEVEAVAGTTRDITERKQAETALREGERKLRLATETTKVGVWEWNVTTDEIRWDAIMFEIYGIPPTSDGIIRYRDWSQSVLPEDLSEQEAILNNTVRHLATSRRAFRIRRRSDGECRHIQSVETVRMNEFGEAEWVIGTNLDVSDQKRAEASLRESEQRFRLVADAAPVLIWVSGTNKLCYWFNQPWLAFTGRSMDAEVGNGWAEGVHPDDLDNCLQTYDTAFDARVPFSMEYRLRRHDGEFRWLIDNGVPRYTLSGEFDGFIGSCLDVTDYKNAEAALRDADRHKDEFLATLAHELRNPLAPIRNGLQVMKLAGLNADDTVEQARTMMERQLTHMVRLVDDLLDISRVTQGKLELRRERLEMRQVIDAAVETSRHLIEQAGHVLSVALPEEQIFVDGDATRLAQVVSNLLTNSSKYTHFGGHIELVVSVERRVTSGEMDDTQRDGTSSLSTHDPPHVAIRVKDDGIGIPPTMLQKVFVMFTQVDRTLEKTTGGLGIGLSLVKGLVEMHGGTIEAMSEGEGKGSEFVVRMPLVIEASKSQEVEMEEQKPIKSSLRILVVDDNRDGANTLAMMLKFMGNDTRTAYDGQAGLDAACEFRPDVILLDIGLPKLNGYEACRSIREQSWGKAILLIAVTGWGNDDDRRRSQEAGFDHHLVKPVDPKALLGMLAEIQVAKKWQRINVANC